MLFGTALQCSEKLVEWVSTWRQLLKDDSWFTRLFEMHPAAIAPVEWMSMDNKKHFRSRKLWGKLTLTHMDALKLFHDYMTMSKLPAEWVPRNLTVRHWLCRVSNVKHSWIILPRTQTSFCAMLLLGTSWMTTATNAVNKSRCDWDMLRFFLHQHGSERSRLYWKHRRRLL